MLERDIRIANVTVKQTESRRDTSARPLHAGIDSRQMTVGLLGFHRRLTHNSSFLNKLSCNMFQGNPLARASNETGCVKSERRRFFGH